MPAGVESGGVAAPEHRVNAARRGARSTGPCGRRGAL